MITEKQKENICNLSFEDKCTIVQTIFEDVGCVSVADYLMAHGLPKEKRRKVYHDMESGKIKHINLMPCINIK